MAKKWILKKKSRKRYRNTPLKVELKFFSYLIINIQFAICNG